MKNMRDIIGAGDKCLSFVGIREDSRRSCQSVAVAFSYTGKRKSFSFPDALQGGGDNMDFVTWSELIYLLISLVTLTFAILSYLNSKKR